MVSRLLDLPGLQIFLPRGEKSTLDQAMETPIMEGSLKSATFNPSLKRLSTPYCGAPGFNDYSPTVVDEELFDFKPNHLNDTGMLFNENVDITQQIDQVKNDLRNKKYAQFNDEFRYSIVSSHILNDYTPYIQKLQVKRSILDLKSSTSDKDKWVLDHLLGENWQNIFNIHFDRLILRCYQMLVSLKKCRLTGTSKQKCSLLLLNAFYLIHKTKQQVHDTAKYKMMLSLKEFLKILEDCDVIVHKFLLNYKTLRNSHIFEESSSLKEHCHDNETSHLVKNLIKSNLDGLFFVLRYKLEKILPLTDKECLSKYTGIYGIKSTDLKYFLNSEIKHLNDKADRVNVIQKFLLCCLLSISFQTRKFENEKKFHYEFDNIFNLKFVERSSCTSNDNVLTNCKLITNTLSDLSNYMKSCTKILINYKDFLKQTSVHDDISTLNSHEYTNSTQYQVIRLLNEIETKLSSITGQREKALIQNKINKILHVTHFDDTNENDNDLYKSDHEYHILDQSNHRIASNSSHRSNRGFSLDIVRHSQDVPSSFDKNIPQAINLNEKVEFTRIDSTMVLSDTEDVCEGLFVDQHDFTTYNDEDDDDDTCIPPSTSPQLASPNVYGNITATTAFQQTHPCNRKSYHYESLHKLSDEELSSRLNEKIINFASENKIGKNQLRAQKSFELLKRQGQSSLPKRAYHSSHYHNAKQNVRNISGPLSTEDTIPIIYEMRELMDN